MSSLEQSVNPVSAGSARDGATADLLDAPEVPAILKDEDSVESPDGLLPRAVLDQNLEVIVPWWKPTVAADPPYIIIVSWVGQGGPFTEVDRFPFDNPSPGEKLVTVPQDKLVHGVYDLSYMLSYGGNEEFSAKKKVTVDRLPPEDGQEPKPLVPEGWTGDITDDYLTQHGQVRFSVPIYLDLKARDRAIYYWTDNENPPDSEKEISEQAFSQDDIDIRLLIITMYERDIRDKGHGQRYVYYRLRDWAGNRGPRSTLLPVFVDLSPAPGNLQPPRVPLSARGLIDRQHAREGAVDQGAVTVEIDPYDNPGTGDKVLIAWNGIELDPLDVDPAQFPLSADVPWSTLAANDLKPDARVTYRVRRGGTTTPPSTETVVPVDLTVAGQDHANAPALLNLNLARLEIYGAVSKQRNKLLTEDYGQPAEAWLVLFDDPWEGQIVEVYWGAISTPVATYPVKRGDAAGQRIPISIPWSAIDQDKQNPRLPVYYTTSNGVNLQHADVTSVEVSIVVIENLKEPSFPHANKYGVLDCCAVPRLWEGVWVRIEGNAQFAKDDTVILHWQGCFGPNGTLPIKDVVDEFPTVLTEEQARNGFEIHVADYEKLIDPMLDNGSALCHYVLKKVNGGIGRSKPEFVIINRLMPSGKICSPDNETCSQ